MKLLVIRSEFYGESTIGKLFVNSNYFCDTLEDTDRKLEIYPNNKIKGMTAIARGIYEIEMMYSNHFKKNMPFLKNVKNYLGVMIHPGNTNADTLGCILVGKKVNSNFITDSKNTFLRLMSIIEIAIENNEKITIEII